MHVVPRKKKMKKIHILEQKKGNHFEVSIGLVVMGVVEHEKGGKLVTVQLSPTISADSGGRFSQWRSSALSSMGRRAFSQCGRSARSPTSVS